MFSKNILFSIVKNKKNKNPFLLSNEFSLFFILENKKLLNFGFGFHKFNIYIYIYIYIYCFIYHTNICISLCINSFT